MTPLDHAGQLLAHLQSHWEEVGGARRTAHVLLEFLNRGARDESKTQGGTGPTTTTPAPCSSSTVWGT